MDILEKVRADIALGKPQEFFFSDDGEYRRSEVDIQRDIDAEIDSLPNVELLRAIAWALDPTRDDPADICE